MIEFILYNCKGGRIAEVVDVKLNVQLHGKLFWFDIIAVTLNFGLSVVGIMFLLQWVLGFLCFSICLQRAAAALHSRKPFHRSHPLLPKGAKLRRSLAENFLSNKLSAGDLRQLAQDSNLLLLGIYFFMHTCFSFVLPLCV